MIEKWDDIVEKIRSLLPGSSRVFPDYPEDPGAAEFVVLDTETTGFSPEQDRILSIGALRVCQGRIRVKESLERFLEQERFDRTSVPIHGILRSGSSERYGEKEALAELLEFMGQAPVVGHHIAFDQAMLRAACRRCGLEPPSNPVIDTGLLYRHTLIKSPLLRKKDRYTLDELAGKFDISCKDRHTALGDAYITAIAFLKILELLRAKRPLTTRDLIKLGNR